MFCFTEDDACRRVTERIGDNESCLRCILSKLPLSLPKQLLAVHQTSHYDWTVVWSAFEDCAFTAAMRLTDSLVYLFCLASRHMRFTF